jgi:hypothetical protein
MKVLLVVCGIIAVIGTIVLFARSRVVPTHHVGASDTARVLEQMRASSENPTFAVFMFSTSGRPSEQDDLNIQFSMEGGRAGFDWVLLAPRNIQDEVKFVEFAKQHGFSPTRHEMNNVKYWRVEEGDIAKLCAEIITDMYDMPASASIELITEGFEWRP